MNTVNEKADMPVALMLGAITKYQLPVKIGRAIEQLL
jgi:hypothetical protein